MTNPFEEFIASLELKGFEGKARDRPEMLQDEDSLVIDEVLARFIAKYSPTGFQFDPLKRDEMVRTYKKAKQNGISFDYAFYLDCLFWQVGQAGGNFIQTARNIFLLGYAFREIEEERSPPI